MSLLMAIQEAGSAPLFPSMPQQRSARTSCVTRGIFLCVPRLASSPAATGLPPAPVPAGEPRPPDPVTPSPAAEPGQSPARMEEVQEGRELGAGMDSEEPASPQSPREPPSPPSPPPLQSPPSPATPESPGVSPAEEPSEAHARQLLLQEWGPPGASLELPPGLTWKLLFLRRPLYRNLLRSPNPEGINIYEPAPPTGPTRQPLETLGNFRGWYIRTEQLQHNCSWTVKHQCVDLLAEGLWEELLDDEQPDITVMDWCPTYSASMALVCDLSTSCTRQRTAWRLVGCGEQG
ncbi:F-box only protein 50 isoform X4 [Myotis lucifugus]|uniref:F-box only protein 50 isoform X4 n=1 Tax=Myotis lucifugus TaxID=59463 RepID=UPI000CCC024B|nr:F-box only protein 50 isoform X4 [Myotis lucifugus]